MKINFNGKYVVIVDGKFVSYDRNSGLMYLDDDVFRACRYDSSGEAHSDISMQDDWSNPMLVKLVALEVSDATHELKKLTDYETELAALKAKYGKD